jgi:hypothetical protein
LGIALTAIRTVHKLKKKAEVFTVFLDILSYGCGRKQKKKKLHLFYLFKGHAVV